MAMVAHDPAAAKRLGIKQSVGKEFVQADKGKKFKEGGMASKMNAGFMAMMKKKAAAKPAKKMASGGLAAGHKSADGIATKGKTKAKQVAMKKGGMCK